MSGGHLSEATFLLLLLSCSLSEDVGQAATIARSCVAVGVAVVVAVARVSVPVKVARRVHHFGLLHGIVLLDRHQLLSAGLYHVVLPGLPKSVISSGVLSQDVLGVLDSLTFLGTHEVNVIRHGVLCFESCKQPSELTLRVDLTLSCLFHHFLHLGLLGRLVHHVGKVEERVRDVFLKVEVVAG